MKKVIFSLLFILSGLIAFSQSLQVPVSAITDVETISSNHPNYQIRGTVISFQNYQVTDFDPVNDNLLLTFEDSSPNIRNIQVFRVTNITQETGNIALFDLESWRGSQSLVAFNHICNIFKVNNMDRDFQLHDGKQSLNHLAGQLNHNWLLMQDLIDSGEIGGNHNVFQEVIELTDGQTTVNPTINNSIINGGDVSRLIVLRGGHEIYEDIPIYGYTINPDNSSITLQRQGDTEDGPDRLIFRLHLN